MVGYIYHGSDLNQIKFYIYPHADVKRGDFVTIKFFLAEKSNFVNIFYQVVNIMSCEESNTELIYGMNIALANLVGSYDDDRFMEFRRLPYKGFPVWKKGKNVSINNYNDYNEHLGYLPGTKHSLPLNINAATVYHTAILGTTGSGKTTLTKKIIKMLSRNNIITIIIDVHGEYSIKKRANTQIVEFEELNVKESLNEFLETDEYKCLKDKIYKDNNDNIQSYVEEGKINDLIDISLIVNGLGKSYDDKKTKNILNYYKNEWYPNKIMKHSGFNLNDNTIGNKKMILLNMKNLQIDIQRWIVANVSKIVYDLYKREETELIKMHDSLEPKAQLALILEEAHIFVPETSNYDLGNNKKIKDKCYNYLANLALRGRKYGLGLYVVSQRSAFIKKGILSQCNTIFALKTINSNDKKVFFDFMDKDYIERLSELEIPEAILVGKASSSQKPLFIEIDNNFDI